MISLNETHDPALHSWVASAHRAGSDFPIQNLPFAVFRRKGSTESFRGGVAIGDDILDLEAAAGCGAFAGEVAVALQVGARRKLNALMALGSQDCSALRLALSRALREGASEQPRLRACLVPQAAAEYDLPVQIGDYTDFYSSVHHATNIGKQFRPDSPLLPNYKWVPIGYHGRASSIGVSGSPVRRPNGQTMPPGEAQPTLGPCRRLDIELELGIIVGTGNALSEPVPLRQAEEHVFGICLLNDWSARDIQAWEYQPLGPFLSKSFATTISPWVVTLEALAPFRVAFERPADDLQPLPYLDSAANRAHGSLDIQLEVGLGTPRMREAGQELARLCRTSYRHAYWTVAQLVAHHTVNGCNLQPGDLLGTGTLSGPTLDQAGALIELTQGGRNPLRLPGGESRAYLEDGDEVVLRGWCERTGVVRIGFGECRGTVLPACALTA
jgi:fumarylacetoacetase